METIKITKKDLEKNKLISWEPKILERTDEFVLTEGYFVPPYDHTGLDPEIYGMPGDRMIGKYFKGQWFNIFEVYRGDSEDLKYWYCNVCRPAVITEDSVYWEDLVVDLQVFPDGRQVLLDMEDFEAMEWSEEDRKKIMETLAFLIKMFKENRPSL